MTATARIRLADLEAIVAMAKRLGSAEIDFADLAAAAVAEKVSGTAEPIIGATEDALRVAAQTGDRGTIAAAAWSLFLARRSQLFAGGLLTEAECRAAAWRHVGRLLDRLPLEPTR